VGVAHAPLASDRAASAAEAATQAAQNAAHCRSAKYQTGNDIDRPKIAERHELWERFKSGTRAREGERCSRVCVPPSCSPCLRKLVLPGRSETVVGIEHVDPYAS
jgi:hypothetical protein